MLRYVYYEYNNVILLLRLCYIYYELHVEIKKKM